MPEQGQARLLPALFALLGRLPVTMRRSFGALLGRVAGRFGAAHARVTATNLAFAQSAAPQLAAPGLVERSLREDAALTLDLAAVWTRDVDDLLGSIKAGPGTERLDRALAAPRPLLLLVPHLGNWELLNLWLQRRIDTRGPFTALYEPLRDPRLDRWVHARRTRSGARLVPTDRSGLRMLLRTLAGGGVVAVLPDQVPDRRRGVHAPFFGHPALCGTLVRGLVRSAAPQVLAVSALRDGACWCVHVLEPREGLGHEDAAIAAAALNGTVEDCVLLAPEQYQWGYKRYRHPPQGSADPYKP